MTASLKIIKLKCTVRALREVSLGNRDHLGNTLRGAFGSTLAWLYDDHPDRRFRNMRNLIFKNETVADYRNQVLGITAKRGNYPNPFLLECCKLENTHLDPDDLFSFNVTLLGAATNYVSEVAIVIRKICGGRIGRDIDAFACESIVDFQTGKDLLESPDAIEKDEVYRWREDEYDAEAFLFDSRLTVAFIEETFLSETAMEYSGPIRGIAERGLPFYDFIRAVLSRVTLLCNGYGSGASDDLILKDLLLGAQHVQIAAHDLHEERFFNHSRTSFGKKIPVKGFTGMIEYTECPADYLPYIKLGAFLHIGGMATRGLGHYVYSTDGDKFSAPYVVSPLTFV
ncbi:MAG: CRISPR system precrRNA processing endoribonuclease RAMP protein Cas6 [Clostridiales Family XIII bacterium]|nr:CRISPR system precrRNA processing endoribonuclease RAMP protein Cas6 [Clostridiales Family XIII bacterium]